MRVRLPRGLVRLARVASTPAVAAAEKAGIEFSLHEYDHDPAAESYGLEAAEKLGIDPARIFKTLIVSVDGVLEVACVPVALQVELKALGKRARMADRTHAERTTGYVQGGISPLGQRKKLPTHLDVSARDHEQIMVSAGRRGLQIELSPDDFVMLTGARVHPIAGH